MDKTIKIQGMSCGHCVNAVAKALGEVDGISEVRVELETGTATYRETQPVDPDRVREAIEKAGYQLG